MGNTRAGSIQIPAKPGTKMALNLGGFTEQLKCSLVGIDPGVCIIVRLPSNMGDNDKLNQGIGSVVRFISDGTVYGFNSHLLGKYISGSLRYLLLAFPNDLEVYNLRGSRRIACHLPSHLHLGDMVLEGVVVDIGVGGASFVYRLPRPGSSAPSIHLGKEVTLVCQLWGMPGEQRIPCQVRNLNLDENSLTLGMAFGQTQEKTITCIKDYVARVQDLLVDEGTYAA